MKYDFTSIIDRRGMDALALDNIGKVHWGSEPQAPKEADGKKRWVCKVCGYIYEGDALPEDFICPICKHPASDFEEMK